MGVKGRVRLGFISAIIIGFFIICANSTPFDLPIKPKTDTQIDDIFAKFIEPSDCNSFTSCESLIRNQSPQIEIVGSCDITPNKPIDPRSLAIIEGELRKQANLTASFEQLMMEKWYSLSEGRDLDLLKSI